MLNDIPIEFIAANKIFESNSTKFFAFDENFLSSKRYKRFIDRTKLNFVEVINLASGSDYKTCEEIIASFFYRYYFEPDTDDIHFFQLPIKSSLINIDSLSKKNKDFFRNFIKNYNSKCENEFLINNGINCFSDMINRCLCDVMAFDFLDTNLISISNPANFPFNEIKQDNYYSDLPDGHLIFVIYARLVRTLSYDLNSLMLFLSKRNNRYETLNNDISDKQKEIDSLLEEKAKLNEQIKSLENQIRNQKKEYADLKSKKSDRVIEMEQYSEVLLRDKNKIKSKYDDLFEKYKKLKSETSSNVEESEVVSDFIDVDINKRYGFVIFDDVTFINALKEAFPNCVILSNNNNISPKALDMVIAITTHINHSTYLGIKKQCNDKKIPIIHCEFTNVGLIKEVIWNYLNS
mgnify:CR=1 FL=1